MSLSLRAPQRAVIAALVLICGCAANAMASTVEFVSNGSFTQTNAGQGASFKITNGTTTTLTDWTNNIYNGSTLGYSFVYASATATASGVSFWQDNPDGTPNGIGASPDGGNFVAMDGAYEQGTLSQAITGLTVGGTYSLSFYYAGAQQQGPYFNGPTTEAFKVTFGSDTYNTVVLNDTSHGFTGWQQATTTFVASNTSETLSFLAVGTPGGVPPFSLLDGVSLMGPAAVTPEPSSLLLLGTGLLSVGGVLSRRFRK